MNGYHFSREVEAFFADIDAMGHVNNVVFLKWIETARIGYWLHVTKQKTHPRLPSHGSPPPEPGMMSGALIDMILARTEIDYRSPVSFAERLDVFVRTALIKRSSIVLEYAIQARSDERVVAQAKTVVVCYDHAAKRSKPVPPELSAAILAQDPEAQVQI